MGYNEIRKAIKSATGVYGYVVTSGDTGYYFRLTKVEASDTARAMHNQGVPFDRWRVVDGDLFIN